MLYHRSAGIQRQTSLTDATIDASRYLQSETRISYFTLILGALAAVPVGYFRGWRWGLGILIGALLAWINFRWLKQGLNALTDVATAQADRPRVKVPILTYFKAMFRYGLIALSVYVIFKYLNVPVLSMILGLCALGAATLAVSVQEVMNSPD
jgi:small-conductance mechanosensitive channel